MTHNKRMEPTQRVAKTSFCDVRDLSAIGLERTAAQGTALRGVMIAYMPEGGMCAPTFEQPLVLLGLGDARWACSITCV